MAKVYLTESRASGPLHLFIATSAYTYHTNYVHSLAASAAALGEAGIPADYCHIAEHCHVDDARNAMVRQFMMSRASHLVFIDNDVGFPAGNLLRLARIDPGIDMVAGVYPLKEDGDGGYPVRVAPGVELHADDNGLVAVDGVPTGFLRISRACIERMLAAYGERKFFGRGQSEDDPPHVILFERTYQDGTRYSGDYAFCEKWKALGGKMYVDPEMVFSHSGIREWEGCLGDYWRDKHGVTKARFDSAISRMRAGRFDAETVQWLRQGWRNHYAAHINTLVACWYAAKNAKVIVEFGSGLTTLVMALSNPDAHVHAIEDNAFFASELSTKIQLLGLKNITLSHSPLTETDHGTWYSPGGWLSLSPDLVLIDGPNRKFGERTAAYGMAGDLMTEATVIIDDADDKSLLDAFAGWCADQGRQFTLIGVHEKTAAISMRKQVGQ